VVALRLAAETGVV